MPTPPLIAFAHVGKSLDGGRVRAVDDVSLEVAEGEFLAIVGGSGSGKTTLLRLANRLIEADTGTITIEGEDVFVDPSSASGAGRPASCASSAASCAGPAASATGGRRRSSRRGPARRVRDRPSPSMQPRRHARGFGER